MSSMPEFEHEEIEEHGASAAENGKPYMSPSPHCEALTRAGTQCRMARTFGSRYCVNHNPDLAGRIHAARAKGGSTAKQLSIAGRRRIFLSEIPKRIQTIADCLQVLDITTRGVHRICFVFTHAPPFRANARYSSCRLKHGLTGAPPPG